ncbi:Fc.00g055980.m01.CDS01 [Cosmosporella sp. VM-42]
MFAFVEGRTFDPSQDIPDLSGKVILVTGGSAGLGKETILQLAKSEAAIRDIKVVVPNASIIFLRIDLGDFKSGKEASDDFLASSDRLDLLINDAGIMAQLEGLTSDGYELQFGTNHMGHALLTKRLLPILEKTSQQPGSDVRIVLLSAPVHQVASEGAIDYQTVTTDMAGISTFQRYRQSKLANIFYASKLAHRYPRITSVSCHPGLINMDLATTYRSGNGLRGRAFGAFMILIGKTLLDGAKNQLWCATRKGVVSGRYYHPFGVVHHGGGFPDDTVLGKQL